jgi:thioredoxin reductase
MTQSGKTLADVLVIGGSHAGMSAALTLYRARHTTIIFDNAKPRNKYSTQVRLTPTWEHQATDKVREASRKELLEAGYTTFVNAEALTVDYTTNGLFQVTDDNGVKWLGRKVLLATGTRDKFPSVSGYADLYGRGIFPCMFQFGHELTGAPSAGLLAMDGLANPIQAMILAADGHKFSDKMVIYTNGSEALAHELTERLAASPGMSVDDRKITRLSRGKDEGIIVEFEDGTQKEEAFIVHRPLTELDRRFVDQLGLSLGKMGEIEAAPPFFKTSVPGVYAAGDCATPMKTILTAMNMGAYAGCGLSRELPRPA